MKSFGLKTRDRGSSQRQKIKNKAFQSPTRQWCSPFQRASHLKWLKHRRPRDFITFFKTTKLKVQTLSNCTSYYYNFLLYYGFSFIFYSIFHFVNLFRKPKKSTAVIKLCAVKCFCYNLHLKIKGCQQKYSFLFYIYCVFIVILKIYSFVIIT